MADRRVKVILDGDVGPYQRAMLGAAATTKAFTKELDSSNDRMSNLVQTGLALGPALVPVAASAVPALAGLSNQLALTTAAAGVTVLAFAGVGDALKSLNDYQLDPSAQNFEKLSESMDKLGPSGQDFVRFLQEIRPELQGLQDAAQEGLFPGLESGISDLMRLMPQAEAIIGEISGAVGDLSAEAGASLAGPEWAEFFDFLETSARPTLIDFGRSLGNLTQGFAGLWMAFDPLSVQFSKGFLQMSRDFNEWADGLDETEGFEEFLDYVSRVGPKVWDTLGAVGGALVEITEAAAPVGEAALPAIEGIADAIASVADSDLGPAVIGIVSLTSAYSRLIALSRSASGGALGSLFGASALGGAAKATKDLPAAIGAYNRYNTAVGRASTSAAGAVAVQNRLETSIRGTAQAVGGGAGLAFVMSDLDNKLHLTNTALGAMAGSVVGPWGTAIGAGIGLVKDFADANLTVEESLAGVKDAFDSGGLSLEQQKVALDQAKAKVDEFRNSSEGNIFSERGDNMLKEYRELEDQYGNNVRTTQDLAFAQAGLGGSMASATNEVRDQTYELLKNIETHDQLIDKLISQEDATNRWKQTLLGLSEELERNGTSLSRNSEDGLANRVALSDSVKALRTRIDADEKAGVAQDELARRMRKGRKAIIDQAVAAGLNEEAVRDYINQLGLTPESIETRIRLYDEEARIKLASLKASLLALPGVGAPLVAAITLLELTKKAEEKRDGGYLTGPGGPRDDRIPIWASNGEFMVNAAATARHRPLLERINAQKFADGGYMSASKATGYHQDLAQAAPAGYIVPPGTRFRIVGPGLVEVADERAARAVSSQSRYDKASRRQKGQPG